MHAYTSLLTTEEELSRSFLTTANTQAFLDMLTRFETSNRDIIAGRATLIFFRLSRVARRTLRMTRARTDSPSALSCRRIEHIEATIRTNIVLAEHAFSPFLILSLLDKEVLERQRICLSEKIDRRRIRCKTNRSVLDEQIDPRQTRTESSPHAAIKAPFDTHD